MLTRSLVDGPKAKTDFQILPQATCDKIAEMLVARQRKSKSKKGDWL